ncbi:hypothetical protein K4K49_000604 [Colletotrichum sp. SAR 10_70]|nr:hypothetical protein K4K50_009131 [Colletotrichum sp. SAR 10_71]KAI8201088.1 hypothetical protein K4K49_000604 [Colletotrichum sp. SAR 10_70]
MDDKTPPTVGKGAIIMINSPKSFGGMDIEDIMMKETISDFTCKVADSLHISNIRIPYFKNKAGKSSTCFPTISGNLVSTLEEWWQNVDSTNKTIGALGGDVMFHPNNIRVLMDATERGIVVNGEFSFFIESSREQDMKIPLEQRAP